MRAENLLCTPQQPRVLAPGARITTSSRHARLNSNSQTCKVAFSRDHHTPAHTSNDPLLLAQSLAATSRECVRQYKELHGTSSSSSRHQRGGSSWTQALLPRAAQADTATGNAAPGQRQQEPGSRSSRSWFAQVWPLKLQHQQQRHAAAAAMHSSGSGRERTAPPVLPSSATSATTLAAADTTSAPTHSGEQQQQQQDSGSSSSSSGGSWSAAISFGSMEVSTEEQNWQGGATFFASGSSGRFNYSRGLSYSSWQLDSRSGAAEASWLAASAAAAAAASTSSPARSAPAADPNSAAGSARSGPSVGTSSSSRKQQQLPGDSSSNGSSPASSGDDADWLTAVLSAPTSRLTSHSNTVLTNSLKRIASLRQSAASSSSTSGLAAAAAAAGVAGYEEAGGLAGLLASIRDRFGSFGLQEFVEMAVQLAQLGFQPDPEWLAAFERSSLAVQPGGSPRLLSRLLLARAKLSPAGSTPPGGTPSCAAWCAACTSHMIAAPDKLSVSSWSNALWALVRLQQQPSRYFQAVFFASTVSRLDDVSPELLTNLVWSLSRLQLPPSFLWWRALVSATATVEKPFSHSQLASLLHSLSLWEGPGGIAAPDVQRLTDLLCVEVHAQLSLMQPSELTTIVAALGNLAAAAKLVPDWEFQQELLRAVQAQLPRFSPAQISGLCWGIAKLDHGLPAGFGEALLLEVAAQMSGLSDSQLASVLWALARLQQVPEAAFRQRLWEELTARCSSLALDDISTLLWAAAKMQLQPPPDLLHELTLRCVACLAATAAAAAANAPPTRSAAADAAAATPAPAATGYDATSLANLVWSLSRLGCQPDAAALAEFERASFEILSTAGLPELVNLARGLGQLRQGPPSRAWQAACLRELRLRCWSCGTPVDCGQLAQLLEELGVPGLAAAAAEADALFAREVGCAVEFQPGCR